MIYRIRTFNEISPRGLERLPPGRYEVSAWIDDPDAVLLRSEDLHAWPLPPALKAIGRAGVGTNNIPVASASRRGIPVFNAPGANANAVCELVIAMMIVAVRNVVPALRFMDRLSGDDLDREVESAKRQFAGIEIASRTLGVIGLGAIGGRVAEAASKLGMRVVGFDPHRKDDPSRPVSSVMQRVGELRELLAVADCVTLHVPLASGTRHLIDAPCLAMMKPGAVLLNFSREAIVDTSAVRDALVQGRLGGYVCDFPARELVGVAGAVALPHLGASTAEAEDNCAIWVADQVREYLEEGAIRNAVNFPDVDMARESPHRIAIANANEPNMLGQISSTLALAGLNIHNMVNKSRGEMAYTLVDVDSGIEDAVVRALCSIRGVLAVRIVPQREYAPTP
ncbi:MAG: phosphoglycerate dehydrogenase [Pseudomonadota bacterium]|nr:phosphoglycerate dehydrogenase [Pseudomonadota bacterium]